MGYEREFNQTKKEYNLSNQLIKSGTSIGANVREGINAQSKADFVSKFNIALKESNETLYWLELLKETEFITIEEFDKVYFNVLTQSYLKWRVNYKPYCRRSTKF